jgi:hypothetical protein
MTCKSGALTKDGSRFSHMLVSNSSTSKTRKFLMSVETKTLKDNQSKSMATTAEQTRDGRSFTLTQQRLKLREFPKLQDSELMFHSSLFLNYQWGELLNVLEPTMWYSRDTQKEENPRSLSSMKQIRPSDLTNGRTMPWKFNPTVVHQT